MKGFFGLFSSKKKKKAKPKGGWVYVGESTRADGTKKTYVGSTTRSPRVRWGEHKKEVNKPNSKTWTGKGTSFRPVGAVWSTNPRKAEKTLKTRTASQKRAFGRAAAKKYVRRKKRTY